jgi:hypothetical protein
MAHDSPSRPHKAVGVYDRPPAWRTRKVLVPAAVFAIVVIAYALYFLV